MNKHILLSFILICFSIGTAHAQRTTDVLDRGLVAVKSTQGVFCSWRIPAEEWYGVTYNIYRDGTKLNDSPLSVSNFSDPDGQLSSIYTVTAVVRGVESPKCSPVSVLEKNYMLITPKHDPNLTSTYVPNDACCADVDGDGVLEILMKYDNESEISASYPKNGHNGEYSLFECLKLDGTVLWWVNCGPNMGDFQNNEQNIVGYDWDGDGKAEVVFRAADGTTIHMADGEVYTVGDPSINYRAATGGGANWFMHAGREYLLYVDGATGRPYQCIDYPLPRLEDDENPSGLLSGGAYDDLVNRAWGDGYGHRSTKHFFGAPYLDGRHPSIFIARGIYTRHKMVTYDVDPLTHSLVERWRWNCNTPGDWYGQGYHNYTIADVDWDGRDEIVFGSMVIDDNGLGLSTTGLGHGDSQHVGDFDPYTHGQEVFACNEDQPNNNFRDATTSKIYYRTTGGNDDGRANMGNFIDDYPGAQGVTSRDPNLVGGASHAAIVGDNKASVTITQNFRIYWDGDLCDESFDYNSGKNTQGAIFKAREGRIALLEGSRTNNDTKGTPCYQGDILGDWREEVIMRDGQNNIRIYTTDIATPWRIYSLWHDHQYRNAMVWQMCGYNQTPHPSYFIGALEGITTPPPPLTMTGRTEVSNGATIDSKFNGVHAIMCENSDMTVNVADGASPDILTVNTPSWTQGANSNGKITTTTYTHTLQGGYFAGDMSLVKQGDGTLIMPEHEHSYSGATEVWAGTLVSNTHLSASPLWLNRFARLSSANGKFDKGITTSYASVLEIGSADAPGCIETSVLDLGFGSIIEIDLFSDGIVADKVVASKLRIEKKDWTNGPAYLSPVIRLNPHTLSGDDTLTTGKYEIGVIGEIEGSIDDLVIEGMDNLKKTLVYEDGHLYLDVKNFENGAKTWRGTLSGIWDIDNTLNFVDDGTDTQNAFYPGDDITFDDSAVTSDIVINENVMPKSITFNNETLDYTLSGEGSIVGDASLVKQGAATLTINNINQYTGGTKVYGGVLAVNSYANNVGTEFGSLGKMANSIYLSNNAVLRPLVSGTMGNMIIISMNNATIEVPSDVNFTLQRGVNYSTPGQTLFKKGNGALTLAPNNNFSKLVIDGGVVNASENGSSQLQIAGTVEFIKGSLYDESNIYSYSTNSTNFVVEEGNSGSFYLDARCDYTGKLTGAGTFNVYAASVRNYLKGDWSAFTGTLNANVSKRGSYDPVFYWTNNYGLPNAVLNISSTTEFNAETRSVDLGNLTGSGTLYTTGVVTVGFINKAYNFNGKFTGNPTLVKVGSGDWKVTKVINGPKAVQIKGGTFSLAPSNVNTVVYTATVTASDSALVRGRGTFTNLVANAGAVIEPGYYSDTTPLHYGPIYAKGDVTINSGATLSLYIRKADGTTNARSFLGVTGALTLNGVFKVAIDPDYAPAVGDEIELWTASSFVGSPSEIILPELPDGLAWDYSELFTTKGVLKVVDATGISDISADTEVICTIYNAEGMLCGQITVQRADAIAEIKRTLSLPNGVYVVRCVSATGAVEIFKIVI